MGHVLLYYWGRYYVKRDYGNGTLDEIQWDWVQVGGEIQRI